MSRLDVVKAQSRQVLSQENLSEEWEYAKLSSRHTESGARTYDTWETFSVLPTRIIKSEIYDQERSTYKFIETAVLRTVDTNVLTFGDKVRGPDGVEWAFAGTSSSGPGTVAYSVSRDVALVGTSDRKAGI